MGHRIAAAPDFRNGARPTELVLAVERVVEDHDQLAFRWVGLDLGQEEGESQGAAVAARERVLEAGLAQRRLVVAHLDLNLIDDDAEGRVCDAPGVLDAHAVELEPGIEALEELVDGLPIILADRGAVGLKASPSLAFMVL